MCKFQLFKFGGNKFGFNIRLIVDQNYWDAPLDTFGGGTDSWATNYDAEFLPSRILIIKTLTSGITIKKNGRNCGALKEVITIDITNMLIAPQPLSPRFAIICWIFSTSRKTLVCSIPALVRR